MWRRVCVCMFGGLLCVLRKEADCRPVGCIGVLGQCSNREPHFCTTSERQKSGRVRASLVGYDCVLHSSRFVYRCIAV